MYLGEARQALDDDTGQTILALNIAHFLRKQYLPMGALVVVGALAGFSLSYTQPRVWEATSIVEIGQVDDGGIRPVDPILQAALRVETESFRDDVLRTLKLPLDNDRNARTALIRHTLEASSIPGTNLFAMTVRGFSPDSAKATLQVAQEQLIAANGQVVDAVRERLKDQLSVVDADLSKLQAAQAEQSRVLTNASAGKDASNGAVRALLGDMVDVTNISQLQMAQQRRAQLLMQLGADHTFNTRVIGETTVSRKPVGPRRPLFAGIGAAFGLFVGLMLAGRRYVGSGRSA